MFGLKTRMTSFLITALAAVIPLKAQIIDLPKRDWALVPGTVSAGVEFGLSVLSYRYGCAHEFSHQQVVVQNGTIDLTFLSKINPAVLCPMIEKPYGPSFKMPALKPGKYPVRVNLLQPCHLDGCKMAIPQEEAGTLLVQEEGKITYVVDPGTTTAGADFTLNLLSPQFTCNLEYLRTSSAVQGNKITLTFLDKANPLIRCIPEKKMYGPAYKMAALKAGTYEVWAVRLPACVEQGCKIEPVPELAGKLVVTGTAPDRKGWYLDPDQVKAGTAFTLNVVNNLYGSCNTDFTHSSLQIRENAIHVTFSIENHPERVCIWDKRPHGPSFNLQPLKAGRYPVTVQVMPACLYTEPRCQIGIPDIMPLVPVDTLDVVQALGIHTPVRSNLSAVAAWRGEALEVLLPAGAQGKWNAEVVTLSGKRLAASTVDAAAGSALIKVGRGERGLAVVRLISPDRQVQTLRVTLND